MGGEWGVGASLAMEKVPPRLRGVLSGLLQEGYAAGYLLAAVCYFFVFPRWGWRPMFFYRSLRPCWRHLCSLPRQGIEGLGKTKHENWGQLGRAICVSHWKLFFQFSAPDDDDNLFVSTALQDMFPSLAQGTLLAFHSPKESPPSPHFPWWARS